MSPTLDFGFAGVVKVGLVLGWLDHDPRPLHFTIVKISVDSLLIARGYRVISSLKTKSFPKSGVDRLRNRKKMVGGGGGVSMVSK
jgi:hypothetical protein